MASLHCHFFSNTLGVSTAMQVILPQPATSAQIGMASAPPRKRYPVLYLLHGWSDDETIWMRRTSIERYAAELPLVIVMPRADLSFYHNMASGMAFWDFISEELPALCKSWFPISPDAADTFVAGLSMGGYGAFRLGLTHPHRFGAAASLSGALDLEQLFADENFRKSREHALDAAIAPDTPIAGSASDLFALAAQMASGPHRNFPLYQCCGTRDHLYEPNRRFRKHAATLGLDLTCDEGPGGHDWDYWDRHIQDVLKWLPIRKAE